MSGKDKGLAQTKVNFKERIYVSFVATDKCTEDK